ncbi:MAG: hypothetical protein ACE5JG_04500, partial [Planctomycetota bacterium]
MPEAGSFDSAGAQERPEGPVRHARFGGILEGRFTDAERLRRAVERCNAVGLIGAELELEGG